MAKEVEPHWVTFDTPGSAVVVNPLSVHYESAVRHMEMISRTKPPLDQDLFGAPDECCMVIENLFGAVYRRQGTKGPDSWPLEVLNNIGIQVGEVAADLLVRLRRFWNRDKHGGRPEDPIEAFKTATPEFAIEAFNLTGALLGAYFLRSDGSRADWIRVAVAVGAAVELRRTSEVGQAELRASWGVRTHDP